MSRRETGIVKRCGCRDPGTGRQAGGRCALLPKRGHGTWYLAVELAPARAAAEAALASLRGSGGQPRAAAAWTTGQWLEAWLAGREALRPSTRRGYRQHLDRYLLPALGRIPLALLTVADLRAMFAGITRERGLDHGCWVGREQAFADRGR